MGKKWICILITAAMTLMMGMNVLAAETKIDKARITFSYAEKPVSGASLGTINASTESSLFEISSAEYINDLETWTVGNRPIVRVELTAKSGYRFTTGSKSQFLLSGCGAEYKRAHMYNEGKNIELDVLLKRISGNLTGSEYTQWNGNLAEWEAVEGAKAYQVRLYRGSSVVTTVETEETTYDFTADMTKDGFYTFRLKAIAKFDGREGVWSEYSNELHVDEPAAERNSTGNRWVKDQNGWWYSYGAGGYPADKWEYIEGYWYYFNKDGYMMTGWQFIGGKWYYLDTSGVMLTGRQQIDGIIYDFDLTTGAMTE